MCISWQQRLSLYVTKELINQTKAATAYMYMYVTNKSIDTQGSNL